MEGLADFNDPMVMPFDELLALGRAYDKANPDLWEKLVWRKGTGRQTYRPSCSSKYRVWSASGPASTSFRL